MEQAEKDISIIIVTRNAEKYIGDSLSIIFNQSMEFSYEVIVIDSSSSDKTCEIIRKFPSVKLITIKKEEFGHGKTRNMGAMLSKGKYLVFLNGDATPKDKLWISSLLENFKDEKVAGVYSRQIPREGAYVCYILEQKKLIGSIKLVKELPDKNVDRESMLELMRFSTVSCAIKKEIWERFRFDEELVLAEDQKWSERILNVGYKIVYEPKSIVYHSHNYTLKEKFVYYYNSTVAFNKILIEGKFKYNTIIKILQLPAKSYYEFISIIEYSMMNKFSLFRIVREIIIAFLLRISGLLGNLFGLLKSFL